MTDYLSQLDDHTEISNRILPKGPNSQCNILLQDFTFQQPLILKGINIWRQTDPTLNITGDIILACPGGNNVITGTEGKYYSFNKYFILILIVLYYLQIVWFKQLVLMIN